ncbi:hypothetical protein [Deinococcus radiodurans]|jgi:hypothetical protein|uniref:Uncharacterized protein n=1 Tax=Deinococcus radiodurans (strain ATCC 13939 / DSM 20539 / JCM 16871 / CCUG 27074 / LMG 4051 / NBRC 15346 / NCIMB 9279 / VKM B-1422 / R1) TaxID=243230 RepID=Q9RZF5_DEIRA|nr:hypothetical protein [Deinococcus radiodurans]AAF12697.1 hypothetical protein DR_C0035 [Deinococcus radiodurans R1 = ATCC 13939 = DSM 20539]ANC73328.1 hypothetical protein A2G07_15870 [Deinococcus radiodurans R1 = ATCC 13939 = DSM 20539]QEM73381.1 hypothetical protein DXG80_16505 [Deinococcus radiodurans]QIP30728.1 hypothetical protein HAV23_15870 [Deinococcus radiodurans]QIP33633.1 hypothetical protein HAV35_15925 [Deinococcus radiodurans]
MKTISPQVLSSACTSVRYYREEQGCEIRIASKVVFGDDQLACLLDLLLSQVDGATLVKRVHMLIGGKEPAKSVEVALGVLQQLEDEVGITKSVWPNAAPLLAFRNSNGLDATP